MGEVRKDAVCRHCDYRDTSRAAYTREFVHCEKGERHQEDGSSTVHAAAEETVSDGFLKFYITL